MKPSRLVGWLMAAISLGVGLTMLAMLMERGNGAEAAQRPVSSRAKAVRSGSYIVDCAAPGHAISPMIYGLGGTDTVWSTGVTARRWGGNPTSRYNWELNTWNLAKDWFFKNVGSPGSNFDLFLDENVQRGVKTAFTVPMLDWVAKDDASYSFPISVFGKQQSTAPELPDGGNGISITGRTIPPGPPTRTSVRSTPESIERWVRQIREKDKQRGRSVDAYILDNEPMLWNSTHRDVHPEPTTYDELLEKTIAYGSAIRRADPEVKIAGPAEWGWQAYHYSAKDIAVGGRHLRPDRRAHDDMPLIAWYLRKLREHEQRTGTTVLDILDVHFYPMGDRIGVGSAGGTDAATSARRIRATRGLWDPMYVDESWIGEPTRVLPQLKEWIEDNYPGRGISIGEWNFGADGHISGGLAVAEVLGRFGLHGVTSAYYWTSPPDRSPAYWGFRAFRNFDDSGGRFLDWSVPVKGQTTLASLFASRDEARRRVVAVLLNFGPVSPLPTRVQLQACGAVSSARGFTYSGGESGFSSLSVSSANDAIETTVAPYSINVLDLSLD